LKESYAHGSLNRVQPPPQTPSCFYLPYISLLVFLLFVQGGLEPKFDDSLFQNNPLSEYMYILTHKRTHRVAMATFWRTFHPDGQINPAPFDPFHSFYHHVQSCGVRTLQLKGQIHSPFFYSTTIRTLCVNIWSPNIKLSVIPKMYMALKDTHSEMCTHIS
jgi:hypothetical protein